MDGDGEAGDSVAGALTLSQTLFRSVGRWQDIPEFGYRVLGSETLDHLENSLNRTTSIVRTLKNATRPAVSLPPEVLGTIFFLVPRVLPFDMKDGLYFPASPHNFFHVDDLRPITAVCHHWRRVAIGTPFLWSTMLDIAPGCVGQRPLHVHYLSRCGGGPLYVALRRELDQDTLEALSRHASRVREIYVYRGGPRFQDLISISLPNLEHCFLNGPPSVRPNTQGLFGNCDGLRTLLLVYASCLPTNHCPALTRLRLNRLGSFNGRLNLPALLRLLLHAPGLELLELLNLGFYEMDSGMDKWDRGRVQLDRLEHLAVEDHDCHCDPETSNGRMLMLFRRRLLNHLSVPDTCAIRVGAIHPSELRHIVDTIWRDRVVTDMRLVIQDGLDTCTFTLEIQNPSASQRADFEVMQRCSTRPGPARDAVVEAVASVLVADVANHPVLSTVHKLCIEYAKLVQWSPFSSGRAFLGAFPQLEELRLSQNRNDKIRVNNLLAALEVSSDGVGHASVCCPLLTALTVDCPCLDDARYVEDIGRSRARAGYAMSRELTIGSWVMVESSGELDYFMRQYDSHGVLASGPWP